MTSRWKLSWAGGQERHPSVEGPILLAFVALLALWEAVFLFHAHLSLHTLPWNLTIPGKKLSSTHACLVLYSSCRPGRLLVVSNLTLPSVTPLARV